MRSRGQKDLPTSKSALTLGRAAAKCLGLARHRAATLQLLRRHTAGHRSRYRKQRRGDQAECAGAISALVKDGLKSAESGQAAVEATQLLADFVRRRDCTGLPPEVVSCLMEFTFPDIISAEDPRDAKRRQEEQEEEGQAEGQGRARRPAGRSRSPGRHRQGHAATPTVGRAGGHV